MFAILTKEGSVWTGKDNFFIAEVRLEVDQGIGVFLTRWSLLEDKSTSNCAKTWRRGSGSAI